MASFLTEIIQGQVKDCFVTAVWKASRWRGTQRWGESVWLSKRCCTIKITFTAGFRQICKLCGCRQRWLGIWRTLQTDTLLLDYWIIYYTYQYLRCQSSDGFGTVLSTVNISRMSWLVHWLPSLLFNLPLSLKISKSTALSLSVKLKEKVLGRGFLQPVLKSIFICTDLGDKYHCSSLNLLLLSKVETTSTVTTEVGVLILSNGN